jgi:hypothetical protein
MAQTGYTPISIYYSSTAAATPTAGNLVAGELAINTADGKLFYKDSAGVVQTLATKGGVGSATNTQVLYNSGGLVVGSANLTFNGTTLTAAGFSGPINGTIGATTASTGAFTTLAYSSTLTGGTGVVNLGSGQFYKDASGNVGIGTATANIYSTASVTNILGIQASGTNQSGLIAVAGTGTGYGGIEFGNATIRRAGVYALDGSILAFYTNNTNSGVTLSERMRISSTGTVGIGTNPSVFATPALQVGSKTALYQGADAGPVLGNNFYFTGAANVYINTGYASAYQLNATGDHVWYSAPSGTAGNNVSLTQLLIVNKDKSLALQGASYATGTGITFPATQSASSDANTLDDYEEGTFTPTVTSGITSPTYSLQQGWYTKIGNTVYVTGRLELNGGTTNGNTIGIGGLPFTVYQGTGQTFPVGVSYLSAGAVIPTGGVFPIPLTNTTAAELYSQGATGLVGFNGISFGNTGNVDFQFFYRVN